MIITILSLACNIRVSMQGVMKYYSSIIFR
jgi:hypothetical protein